MTTILSNINNINTTTINDVSLQVLYEITTTIPGNPIYTSIVICVCVSIVCFIVSTITNNYSQVDKLWSIMPVVYSWIFIIDTTKINIRLILMACIVTIWGIRLTYNFNRRGGYTFPYVWYGDEDYRWSYIQKNNYIPILYLHQYRVIWILFNFFFISFFQHILLLLLILPSIYIYVVSLRIQIQQQNQSGSASNNNLSLSSVSSLNWIDYSTTILILFFIIIESIADNQQYTFQTEKYRYRQQKQQKQQQQQQQQQNLKEQESKTTTSAIAETTTTTTTTTIISQYEDGFNQSGLYSIVRKPNFIAEQCIWICYYFYSIAATVTSSTTSTTSTTKEFRYYSITKYINTSCIGCIVLVLLFHSSGTLTEHISKEKYPNYRIYEQRVPRYIPHISTVVTSVVSLLFGKTSLSTLTSSVSSNPMEISTSTNGSTSTTNNKKQK